MLEGGLSNASHEIDLIRENSTLISFLYPAQNKELINELQKKVRGDPHWSQCMHLRCLPSVANNSVCYGSDSSDIKSTVL